MKFTEDSIRIQKTIQKFDKLASENLTKTRTDIIKSFFIKLNKNHYDRPHCIRRLAIFRNHIVEKHDLFNVIPYKIRTDIENHYNTAHFTTYIIHSKIVNYHIYDKTELKNVIIENMIYKMNLWLSIAIEQANNECSNKLDIYLFLTDHKKILPEHSNHIDKINVNTAFTTSCSSHNRAYIYRKEEWFKVFIHETFHCLGLDFSNMDTSESNTIINTMFSTNIGDVRLYESYCETWAETFNLVFIAFIKTPSKIDYKSMFEIFQKMYNEELTFSIYQMVTILNQQNIRYVDLIRSNKGLMYNEKTNAFSYYILKTINMFHMNHFLSWCKKNNTNIINFTNTQENISKYCDFIRKRYSNDEFLKTIKYIETQKMVGLNTLRMTAFEIV